MDESRQELYKKCRAKLLELRQDILNGLGTLNESLSTQITGDEGDMASALETQHTSLARREKLVREMREIDAALQRIEDGSYGMCEETEEPIEHDRLLAIPFTRLSAEGAELRERNRKRFA